MINFTLTITAAPELLAEMSRFTSAITCAKVVTVPQTDSDFIPFKVRSEKLPEGDTYMQQAQQAKINPAQETEQQVIIQTPVIGTTIVPTSAQIYTMEQLAVAATQIVDIGRRTELVDLLSSFGVQALTALPKEQYGSFATQIRALGAKI